MTQLVESSLNTQEALGSILRTTQSRCRGSCLWAQHWSWEGRKIRVHSEFSYIVSSRQVCQVTPVIRPGKQSQE